jgi:hypothetical protein
MMFSTLPVIMKSLRSLHGSLWIFAAAWPGAVAGLRAGQADAGVMAPHAEASLSPAPAPFSMTSDEQGQVSLLDAFDYEMRQWRLDQRREALEDTQFRFNPRLFFLSRDRYDGTHMESFAVGGWAGLKTGYFLDRVSFGATVYTSQHLSGDVDEDGALLLAPGQEGYTALGELYADIRIKDDLNLYIGRKEYDTPYLNRNDTRMTPNTFEAISLIGKTNVGSDGGVVKFGLGYFDQIKERNSDDFVSMAKDAGADVNRGVFTAGALYQKGNFSFGGIDYYSDDIINIAYLEAKMEFEAGHLKPRVALQFTDQRSVGDDLLTGDDFSARQWGVKAELPVGNALFTAGYTGASGDTNMQNPWSSYPGFTAVQVEDFNRDGEEAFIVRAAYEFPQVPGLSTYALWVHGSTPDAAGQFSRDEYDFNLQWAPPDGKLKGLSLRLRYALVEQDHASGTDDLEDFRFICNYTKNF